MASASDLAVLQTIFNPTTPFGDIPALDEEEQLKDDDSGFDADVLAQVRELELQGVCAAESGDVRSALERFTEAIRILPERASAYNNRAQARRLQGDTAGALEDLGRSISLSGGAGRTGCQALVQRGLVHRLARREEEAREDFQRAACLGSAFARQQVVNMNPYAAICNIMLAQVINKMRNPELPGARDH
ncbi:UNVERIFIED_CONTAM: hypothetical protein FKN15_018306 [Acipenser sinensis]